MLRLRLCLFCLLLLAACTGRRGQELDSIPTPASIEGLATAQFQTENAPPPGFRDTVSFPQIDRNPEPLPGWRYEVELEVRGTFSGTPREASGTQSAEILFNQVANARRVEILTEGQLLEAPELITSEAVQLGPTAYFVSEGVCERADTTSPDGAGSRPVTAASLGAGQLIGGVTAATPTGRRATINGEESWQYSFAVTSLTLGSIELASGGTINGAGELWLAPARNAVVRFYADLNVTGARILGSTLPVDGTVLLRYDVYDIGQAFNISVPFGCEA